MFKTKMESVFSTLTKPSGFLAAISSPTFGATNTANMTNSHTPTDGNVGQEEPKMRRMFGLPGEREDTYSGIWTSFRRDAGSRSVPALKREGHSYEYITLCEVCV